MRETGLRAARQAAGWHAPRPVSDDLRELAEMILEVTGGREGALPTVILELAGSCRHVAVEEVINAMIGGHIRRRLCGEPALPPLGGKAAAFHRSYADRAAWEWLACR